MDTIEHVDQLQDHWWWRPGWRAGRHFYACHITIDDQSELQQLVAVYQAALGDLGGLDLIPQQWLHLTLQGIGFIDEVTDDEVDNVRAAIVTKTAHLSAPVVAFHRPVIRPEAVYLPAEPSTPLQDLRAAVQNGVISALGPERVADAAESLGAYRPHVSIAYSNTSQNAQPIVTALSTIVANPVQVTLDHLSLLKFHRDHRMYEWTANQPLPLAAAST